MANLEGVSSNCKQGQVRLLELVHVGQAPLQIPQRDVGEEAVVVWDAALVLAHFLLKHRHFLLNKTVLELGAGTGAVGLAAAALGAKKVILTDLPRFLPLLEEAIELNPGLQRVVEAKALTWGKEDDLSAIADTPELILVSDCIYYEASVDPLIATLKRLADLSSGHCQILLSYEARDYLESKKRVATDFFRAVGQHFLIKPFPTSQCHEDFSSDDIRVLQLSLK